MSPDALQEAPGCRTPHPPGTTPGRTGVDLETCLVRFETALERMSHGVCFFDGEQRLILANRRYAELYDLAPESILPGMTLREVIELRVSAGSGPRTTPDEYHAWRNAVAARDVASETAVEMANGRTIVIKHQPMPDGGWVATHEDITEQRRSAERIAHMAHHDALTSLANRVLFRQALEEAMRGAPESSCTALLYIDLDRFKPVNDTLGHQAGDLLLCAVAGRLRSEVAEGDIVARLGGDEFAVIRSKTGTRDAEDLARRIVEALGRTFELDGHRVEVGASVGVALAPDDGAGPDELLRSADLALYRAKAGGRGQHRFFEPETDMRLQVSRGLQHDLREAIEAGGLELHYQPVVEVATRQVLGFEALLRWRHPERGLVMPQTIMPLAEGSGMMPALGDWALQRACAEVAGLAGRPKLAVNVSPLQLTPEFPARVAAALAASGLEPARLELDVTEATLLHETEAALGVLHKLRGLGVGVAMDGFGAGTSSLSALRRFPFTRVKLDRGFVRNLGKEPDCAALLRAIVDLCGVLRMPCTAEGVETEEQFAAVAASGCTEAQGFLFGRPAPIARWLDRMTFAKLGAANRVGGEAEPGAPTSAC
jgi:diguanylate cyclase (GGDEF)-like protein